jgi:hypothetical protein
MILYGEHVNPSKPDIVKKNLEFSNKIGVFLRIELLNYKLAGEKKQLEKKTKKRKSSLSD